MLIGLMLRVADVIRIMLQQRTLAPDKPRRTRTHSTNAPDPSPPRAQR